MIVEAEMYQATLEELNLSDYTWRSPRKEWKIKKKLIFRCKKVQITVSTTSKEQKQHRLIDNEFCFLKIYRFCDFCCILETEKLFLIKIPQFCQKKVDHERVNGSFSTIICLESSNLKYVSSKKDTYTKCIRTTYPIL